MKRNRLLLGLLSLIVVSCSVEEIDNPEKDDLRGQPDVKYYAVSYEQPGEVDTKTFADSQLRVLWNEDDRITIFDKKTLNEEFCFDGEDGDNAGGFYPAPSSGGGYVSYSDLTYACAVYPYQKSTKISYDGIVTFTLPEEQTYMANSFGRGANIMIAKTTDNQLKFKNVGGYLSFKFYGSGVSVSSITLKGNNNEPLAGKCKINMSSGEPVTTVTQSTATDEITLICSTPIPLGTSSNPTEFWIVVPPTTFSQGITFTVHTSNGGTFEKSSSASFTVGRNKKMQVPAMEVVTGPVSNNDGWFSDIDGEANNTVRLVVPDPSSTISTPVIGGDVTLFQKDINLWFSDNSGNTGDEFFFSDWQPKINGNQLYTNWWGPVTVNGQSYGQSKLLYVVGKSSTFQDVPVYEDGEPDYDNIVTVPYPQKDLLIAWIMPRTFDNETGLPIDILKFLSTAKSKALLSLWSGKETDQAKMMYANLEPSSRSYLTYNGDLIYFKIDPETGDFARDENGNLIVAKNSDMLKEPFNTSRFHVRFIRPIDINISSQTIHEDSNVEGLNAEIAKFISGITDSADRSVIVKETLNGPLQWTGYYVPGYYNDVNLYDYYQFTTLSINLNAAEINNWDPSNPYLYGKVSEVFPESELRVGELNTMIVEGEDYYVFSPFYNTSTYTIDVSCFNNLRDIYINYNKNGETVPDSFQLRIPVQINYAWGSQSDCFFVKVN